MNRYTDEQVELLRKPVGENVFFNFFIMPSLFVVYSFHSPQVLLEFSICMPLSATTFFSVCFPVSSGPLYFSSEFCGLYLFILEGADSLVSISGLRPLPGWDNGVHSSRPRTAGTSAMEEKINPPSPFPSPIFPGWPLEFVSW